MTREVAIRNLEMIRIAFVNPVTKEQRKLIDDTVDMAISALSENKCFDGMTNGEVIEEIYRFHSDMNCGSNGEYVHIWSNDGNCQMTIHKDFWNAPYQKGGDK